MNSHHSPAPDDAVHFGPFIFYRQQRLVCEAGRPLSLGGRALDILAVLVEHAGQFVAKDVLIRRVWPCSVVEESNLRVHIAALRRALGDGREGRRYIVNLPQRGYCFVASVPERTTPSTQASHNLPARLSPLIGQDQLLRSLARGLAGQSLLTLTGGAGVGKSRLASSLAERLLPRYRDGAWWVDLANVSQPAAMFQRMAEILMLPVDPRSTLRGLCQRLASRQVLLVLDGCDHLLDACRSLLLALREVAPHVTVLVTSRELLRIPGERVQRIGGLSLPPLSALASVDQAMEYPAMQLFVKRAQAAQQGFTLREQDLPALREICRRLDGIPLALELAAAQVPVLGVRGLLGQLAEGLQVLSGGRRTAVERHQSLSAAMHWTYQRLSLPQRWLFLQLALFRMAVTLPTLSAMVAGSELAHADLDHLLKKLVDTSLLAVEPGPGPRRYRLLNSVRAYALSQLGDPAQVARLQQGYGQALGRFSTQQVVLQAVEQFAYAD
ncbi:ATP-binding protein [Pseudomonas mucidolens]|uniref:ATP-binding protein n=1 Tax=Pseudomonas mucidolens TaxID=46679 RepID=UPI0030DB7A74